MLTDAACRFERFFETLVSSHDDQFLLAIVLAAACAEVICVVRIYRFDVRRKRRTAHIR